MSRTSPSRDRVLELFVVYPDRDGWTAESLRRRDGSEEWVTLFKLTCTTRDALMERLAENWRGVTWTEMRPTVQ